MPITVTTCDDNVPHVELFEKPDEVERALIEHYREVWSEVAAEGDMPATWQEIRATLETRDLLRDRHVAHVKDHRAIDDLPEHHRDLPSLVL